MTKNITMLNEDSIKDKIYNIRGMKVMLDKDLAELYEVSTGRLNEAVKRNKERFPKDFMFQLTKDEFKNWVSQFAIANSNSMGFRISPHVFTEQGVTALSGVIKSKKAIEINIKIVRAFVSMRKFISQNSEMIPNSDYVYKKLFEHENKLEIIHKAMEDNILTKKRGVFVDGEIFEAHKFISDLIKSAKESIILIDNYIDDSVLTLFSERNKDVKVIIYTRDISKKLKLDLEKFNEQYEPIEIKKFNKSHDRFLIIDDDIYHFGASLKDLGKKWFAFSKFEKEAVKILNKLE